MSYDPDRYVEALRFAAQAHLRQKEPGSELPYLVHVTSVASEVIAALAAEPMGQPDLAVQCALLHDTVEDTDVTLEMVAARFGPAVAAGVDALSKRADLPKEHQMEDSLQRIRQNPREIAMVKLADRIINLKEPPHYWSRERCATYQEEARLILRQLAHASPWLAARLAARIAAYEPYTR